MEYYTNVGQRVVHLPGCAWGKLDIEQQSLEIVCGVGQEGSAYDGCLIPLLCELLAYHGHYVIHAASLSVSGYGDGMGIMLSGVSGSGKTTTSLALACSGMSLLTDDMSFIALDDSDDSRVKLWGVQLPCKIHDCTRKLLPWLAQCSFQPTRVEGESGVNVRQVVGDSTGIMVAPRMLLLLGPRTGDKHVILPMNKTEAMTRLTGENIRAYEHQTNSSPARAFRALARLIAQCDVYHLCVGNSLETLPDRIRGLLSDPS